MTRQLDVDPEEWQKNKRQRIEEMRKPQALPPPSGPLVSAPTNHEVAGFMPGRLEFEHEVENEAEMAVKDLEFGLVWKFGGDQQPEAQPSVPVDQGEEEEDSDEEEDEDKTDKVKEEDNKPDVTDAESTSPKDAKDRKKASGTDAKGKKKAKDEEEDKDKEDPPPDIEDEDELDVKLALLDIYFTKLDKREEAKELIFDRGLTEYKKVSVAERVEGW